jgi:hypothetical protein
LSDVHKGSDARNADASTILAHWIRSRDGEDEALVIDIDPHDMPSSLEAAVEEFSVALGSVD